MRLKNTAPVQKYSLIDRKHYGFWPNTRVHGREAV